MTGYNYDPELAPYIALLPGVIDFSSLEKIQLFRSKLADNCPPLTNVDNIEISNFCIPGSSANAYIPVRSYRPKGTNQQILPAIFEIHGGGFILGDLDMQDQWCIDMALASNAFVISIDYRLAPEHPFPAAPDDCYRGFLWLFDNAHRLGINPARIALSGQSAGACLAAATAIRARNENGPTACLLVLEIPVTDHSLSSPSMSEFVDTPMWNKPNAESGWKHYLGNLEAGDITSYAAPALEQDLSGLPSSYISVMEFDPLRDEGIAFATRLMQAGVSVELHSFPGTFHGCSLIAEAKVTQRSSAELKDVFKRHL